MSAGPARVLTAAHRASCSDRIAANQAISCHRTIKAYCKNANLPFLRMRLMSLHSWMRERTETLQRGGGSGYFKSSCADDAIHRGTTAGSRNVAAMRRRFIRHLVAAGVAERRGHEVRATLPKLRMVYETYKKERPQSALQTPHKPSNPPIDEGSTTYQEADKADARSGGRCRLHAVASPKAISELGQALGVRLPVAQLARLGVALGHVHEAMMLARARGWGSKRGLRRETLRILRDLAQAMRRGPMGSQGPLPPSGARRRASG